MAIENVKDLLKTIRTDTKAQAKLAGLDKAEGEDGTIRYFAKAAKILSFDVTEADLRAFLEAQSAAQVVRTENAAEQIKELGNDELEAASGGGRGRGEVFDTCHYSFKNFENCWVHDGCDVENQHYEGYMCRHNYAGIQCGTKESQACDEFVLW